MTTFFYKGRTPDGRVAEVEVRGSKIRRVVFATESQRSDGAKLPYLLPVLVDLQHNGALGAYYGDIPEMGLGKLHQIASHLRRKGVGRCLLTMITQKRTELNRLAAFLGDVLETDRELARLFFGIFHEGVFISPKDGWRGAHSSNWIELPDWERLKEIDELTGGRIKLVNVAPEEPGGLEFIEKAVAAGKMISLGHCCPSAEVVDEAISLGATMVTHFGNGAASQIHRFENPLWTFLDREELTLGLICDGFHLPGAIVRIAMKCKGRKNCLPVSDASGCSGLRPGAYEIVGGRRIEITSAGRVHMAADPEILAGGWFQQDRSVEFLVKECGFTFLEAWDQCSRLPAQAIGIRLPELAEGEEASFVMARWDDGLVIERAVHGGIEEPVSPDRDDHLSKLDSEFFGATPLVEALGA